MTVTVGVLKKAFLYVDDDAPLNILVTDPRLEALTQLKQICIHELAALYAHNVLTITLTALRMGESAVEHTVWDLDMAIDNLPDDAKVVLLYEGRQLNDLLAGMKLRVIRVLDHSTEQGASELTFLIAPEE